MTVGRAGQRRPDDPRRLAAPQRLDESTSAVVRRPLTGRGTVDRLRGITRGPLLRGGMSRWHRESYDIGERARVTVGDGAHQPRDVGPQDHLGRDRTGETTELAGMLGLGQSFQHVTADLLAGEAYDHPGTRHGGLVHPLGYEVVEGPVEVRERYVDGDACDRPLRGQCLAIGYARAAYRLFEQR